MCYDRINEGAQPRQLDEMEDRIVNEFRFGIMKQIAAQT